MPEPRKLLIRRVVVSVASLAVAAILHRVFHADGDRPLEALFVDTAVAVPVVAAALIWSARLSPQLLARGAWWSLLLVGGLMALVVDHRGDRQLGAGIAACCAVALLVAGGSGLGASRGRFAPVAFRGTLVAALVLAIADTGAFLWFGSVSAVLGGRISVLLVVPLMVAGVIGLLRLRTWGLMVSFATNVLIVILALTETLFLPGPMRAMFIGTALLQLVVPLPMLVSMIRGKPPNPEAWRRTKIVLPVGMIVAAVMLSAYGAFVHHGALLDVW